MSKDNKYEDIEMLDVYDYEEVYDIICIKIEELEDENYIAVYGKRDLISYLFTEMIKDEFMVGYVNFDVLDEACANDIYLLLVRNDGTISVEPGISNSGKVLGHDAKIALVDMDNCPQSVVDYCVNTDKKVVLFGESDNEDEFDVSFENTNSNDMHGFTVNHTDEYGYSSYSFYSTDLDLVERMSKLCMNEK